MVSNWEPAHSLVEDAVSWDKIAATPCLLALAVAQLPLCLWEVGPYMAVSLLNPLFCESTRGHHEALEPFVEMVLYFCLSGDPRVWVAVSHYCLRLSSWHSGLVLTLRTDDWVCSSLPSPHSLVVDTSIWATFLSPLVVVVRCVFCAFFFFFSSWLCCPLRFQNSPYIHLWGDFLLCGNFSSSRLPPKDESLSLNFVSLFLSFIFCTTSSWRDWTAFLGA